MTGADVAPSRPSGPLSHPKAAGKASVDILDIRRADVQFNIKADILSQFHPETGPRTLPTLLLYNERGLQLFEDVSPANGRLSHLSEADEANTGTDHVSGRVLSDQ